MGLAYDVVVEDQHVCASWAMDERDRTDRDRHGLLSRDLMNNSESVRHLATFMTMCAAMVQIRVRFTFSLLLHSGW